jgi:hypothetical protein
MKRYPIYTIIFLLGLLIMGSCSDDSFDKSESVKEGIPTKLTLSIATSQMQQIKTKAALTDADFNAVYDVYVFVFDKNHNLEVSEDFSSDTPNTSKSGTFTLSNSVTSGVKYIYAIANATKHDDVLATLKGLTKGTSFSTFNALTYTMSDETVQRTEGALLMSGAFVSSESSDGATGYCLLEATDENQTVAPSGVIELKHLDSQIKFVVKVGSDNIKFTPRGWAIYNAPKNANLIEQTSDVNPQTLFDIADANFEVSSTQGGSFVFYMMENRKAAKATINSSNKNLRESMSGSSYVYADDNAAYVQIKGSYEDYKDGKLYTYGDVVYTIHLGDFDTEINNFETRRNVDYTYTITVNGVNNIIAEVQASDEQVDENDGADGNIYRSTSQYVMDAHYGTALVTFYKSDLAKANIFVAVSTPYAEDQYYYYDGTQSQNFDTDYKWVMFVRNASGYTDGFAQYPGTTSQHLHSSDATGLMTIKEVIAELKANVNKASFWNDGEVVYTAFVDEYYYEGSDQGKSEWKSFTNASDRTFSIYTSPSISYDQKSTYSEPTFRITQRSIKSFYNTSLSSLTTAWGVETINEDTNQKPISNNGHFANVTDTKTNGRYCTWYQLRHYNTGTLKWNDFVDYQTNELTSDYNYAEYAFLTRNRDLNGDGTIDNDELRWYTCATNQYVGMWIGQAALPAETHLFQGDASTVTESNRFGYHLLSSNNVRFWPEEGVSTGSNTSGNYGSASYPVYKFYVRCARNLGGFYTGEPQAGTTYEPLNYVIAGSNYIDLSRMNTAALRTSTSTTISASSEHSGGELNQPYTSFRISSSDTDGYCPTGYRVPNQRELALMAGFVSGLNTSDKSLGSCTYSDLKYKSGYYYLLYNSSLGQFISINNDRSTYYRCVKDGY